MRDAAALEAILPSVYPWARSRARLLAGSAHAAEDLVQDALVAALRRPPQPLNEETLRAWLTTVLFRLHLRRGRRLAAEAKALMRLGGPVEEAPPEPAADVMRALASLPPRQRACAVLFYVEDMSEEMIAETLSIRHGTVKAHLAQARASLRSLLGDASGDVASRPPSPALDSTHA